MIKILLTSDIHLGSEADNSPVPEEYRIKTFKKLLFLAKSHDLFIIAGDLFHNNGINKRNMDFIAGEFKKLRESGVEIIYILGEQELDPGRSFDVLNVSKLFTDPEDLLPFTFFKNEQEIYIYSLPVNGKHNISEIKKVSGNGFHLGVFHADFYLNEEKNPSNIRVIEKEDIVLSGMDFYALGHNHQFKLFKSNGRYIGAYPGSPEAITFAENGDRYAISFTVKDNEIYQIKRLTVNSAKVESVIFDLGNSDNLDDVIKILNEKKSGNTILEIQLTGTRNFKMNLDELNNMKNEFLGLYIKDKTFPNINLFIDEFMGEESLRGEFFQILQEKINKKELQHVDVKMLTEILSKVINSGLYTLEDLCNYWSA